MQTSSIIVRFCIDKENCYWSPQVLLGLKKRGFGLGLWQHSFAGKVIRVGLLCPKLTMFDIKSSNLTKNYILLRSAFWIGMTFICCQTFLSDMHAPYTFHRLPSIRPRLARFRIKINLVAWKLNEAKRNPFRFLFERASEISFFSCHLVFIKSFVSRQLPNFFRFKRQKSYNFFITHFVLLLNRFFSHNFPENVSFWNKTNNCFRFKGKKTLSLDSIFSFRF